MCKRIRRNNRARVAIMSCVDKTRTPLTAIKGVNREESAVCTRSRRPPEQPQKR